MRHLLPLLVVALLPGSLAADLLVNGDFEAGDLTGWTRENLATDVVAFQNQQTGLVEEHEGDWFLTMADLASGATAAWQEGVASLLPGNLLVLTGRIQTEDLADDDFGRAWIRILDAGGATLDSVESGVLVTPSFQWNHFQVVLEIPAGAAGWRVDLEGTLEFGSFVNVFWDDLELRETESTATGKGFGSPGVHLAPVHPNPVRAAAELRYRLDTAIVPSLVVLDVRGRVVRDLAAPGGAGEHAVRWDGRDRRGTPVPAGIYFVRLATGAEVLTRSIAIVR
jgi:hypothetical protein